MKSSPDSPGKGQDQNKVSSGFSVVSFLITFVLMFVTWIVLSGNFSGLLISLGVISSLLVAWFFHDLLFPGLTWGYVGVVTRFCAYTPWLIGEIMKANFHLLKIVFSKDMHALIDPHIIQFNTDLKSDLAVTTLANSITLTPGTITVTANTDGVFQVHAIDRPSAEALPGAMLEKVAGVYGDENK